MEVPHYHTMKSVCLLKTANKVAHDIDLASSHVSYSPAVYLQAYILLDYIYFDRFITKDYENGVCKRFVWR